MPDYSACSNVSCERRYDCARYMMKKSSMWQSNMAFEAENCKYFFPILEASFECLAKSEMKRLEFQRVKK